MNTIQELKMEISKLKRLDKSRLYDWNVLAKRYNENSVLLNELQKKKDKENVKIELKKLEEKIDLLIDCINVFGNELEDLKQKLKGET